MENIEMKQPAATHAKDQNQEPVASGAGNAEEANTANSNGLSKLFLAVNKGNLPCVKLLVLKNAADVNEKACSTVTGTTELDESWVVADCGWGLSPFLLACRLGHQSIVEFLFYNGAKVKQTSAEDNLNCLSLAIMYSREETAKFLVTHTKYEDLLFLMKTVSRDLTLGPHAERISTPMRQLIQYMPDVAAIVMDRCITLNEKDDVVTCHVELLDDYYSPWALQNKGLTDPTAATAATAATAPTAPTAPTTPNDPTKVFDIRGNLLVGRKHKPKHAQIKKGQHPLALMQKQELHANLLTHPLSIKLIEHKWRILASAVNSVSLIVYLLFLAFLTGYVLVNPPSSFIKFTNISTIIWYYEPDKLLPETTYSEVSKVLFGGNSYVILLALVILNIIKEIFQMYSQGRSYLNYQSLLEWSIYVLTLALIIPVSGLQYEGYELREKWQWQCGALSIFLAWINLALYVRQTSTFGIYVIMFEDVLFSTVKFLAVILLFLIAFALAFNTLLLNQTDFHSFGESFIRTIAMTTGELDFSRIFHSQNYLGTENVSTEEDYVLTSVFSDIITNVMFVVFVITMPIIATNLLIGVAVEDIHRIRQKATFYYMKLKVDRVISAENMALGTPLGKYIIRWLPITVQSMKIQLSHRSKLTRYRTWFASVVDFEQLRESVRAVCKRNQERKELRDQLKKSSCSHMKDQPDGRTDETLLQKLCQMRDQMQAQMQDQILKVNGLISQVEQPTG